MVKLTRAAARLQKKAATRHDNALKMTVSQRSHDLVKPKGGDALRLGSKGRYGSRVGGR